MSGVTDTVTTRGSFTSGRSRLSAGSGVALLDLRPALLELFARDPKLRALLAPGDMSSLIYTLRVPDDRFGEHPEALTGVMFVIFSIGVAAAEAEIGRAHV